VGLGILSLRLLVLIQSGRFVCWAWTWKHSISRVLAAPLIALSITQAPVDINAATSTRESIAKMAAVLPGMGQPDVFYPQTFAGTYITIETITAVETKVPPSELPSFVQTMSKRLNSGSSQLEYLRTYSSYDDRVVLDRATSASERFTAITGNDKKSPIVAQAKWDVTNPNILSITTASPEGRTYALAVKVTKRSQETNLAPNAVGYSEFSQIAETESESTGNSEPVAIPNIYGMRVLARYQQDVEKGVVDGLERLYIYRANSLDTASEEPIVVVKSRIHMNTISMQQTAKEIY